MTGKPRPLVTRLRLARTLLREWQAALRDSHKVGVTGHPDYGKVVDPQMVRELAKFDEARAALTEAIRDAKGPAMRPGRGLTQCDMHEDESY